MSIAVEFAAIRPAKPPVAMTLGSLPISAITLARRPSKRPINPYTTPDWIEPTVVFWITCAGFSIGMLAAYAWFFWLFAAIYSVPVFVVVGAAAAGLVAWLIRRH